jgi:group I intron endonuclease
MTTTKGSVIWEERNLIDQKKNLSQNVESGSCGITTETKNDLIKNVLNDTTKVSGIYKIVNRVNGKYYIGSSKDIYDRWKEHKQYLIHKYHPNDYLQHAWNKYGEDAFDFVIIEKLLENELKNIEQKYLDKIKGTPSIAYNLRYDAVGGEMSEYSKKKIGDKNRGKKRTIEARLKMSLSAKNRPPTSKETKHKISLSKIGNKNHNFGKILSKETKLKLSKSNGGKNNPKFNSTIYTFKNKYTNEIFTGVCYDFRKLYNISSGRFSKLIKGKLNHIKGWILSN